LREGVCTLAAPGAKGLLPDALVSKWAALRRDAALPCALQLAAPASAPAPPATSDGLGAVVKEIVVGASWVQHGAAERMLDRICGADARVMIQLSPTERLCAPDALGCVEGMECS
jgi:hypothetical protein